MPYTALYQCTRCKSVVSLYVSDKNTPLPEYSGTDYHKLRRENRGPCGGTLKLCSDAVHAAQRFGGQEAVAALYPADWYVSL